ncbi:MAG: glyoxylate/hydroxypyruvate reductase A [Polaribacter sp.]|jgi:glyoxylate/hydroxypyruvate reductase A
MNPVILFVSKLPAEIKNVWIEKIQKALPEELIVVTKNIASTELGRTVSDSAEIDKIEIAIVANPDLAELKELKSLKWVHALGAGVEGLIDVARENKFQIVRMIDPNLANTMAESVLVWTLFINKKIPTYLEQQNNKLWKQQDCVSAYNCKVGFLGLGEMGIASANKLLENNFQVLGWSRSKKSIDGVQTFYGERELNDFVSQCQILICLLPLTNETKGIINRRLLKKLPKGASVINFSRGGMLNTDDLIKELDSEHIYHAVLDVFDQEPLAQESVLWSHNQITVLPHVAAITDPDTAAVIVAKNIKNYRNTSELKEVVNLARGY